MTHVKRGDKVRSPLSAMVKNLTAQFWVVTHETFPKSVQVRFSLLVDIDISVWISPKAVIQHLL